MAEGFVYYNFGQIYLDEAFVSIKTLLKHNHGAKVCLITDEKGKEYVKQKYNNVGLDQIKCVNVNVDEDFWASRLRIDELSPYDKTIYLDCDTYILADIQNLFDLLDTFDFVAVPDESHPPNIAGLKGGYKALNYYNCGFFLFRKSAATHRLFKNWLKEYINFIHLEPHDQRALLRALIKTDIRFITLPKEYNLRLINKCASFQGQVKIIHGRAKNPEKLIKMINNINSIDGDSRVWIPNLQRIIKAIQFRPYYRILKLLNLDNVQESVGGKESVKSISQKIAPYLRKKLKCLKKK